MHSKITVIIIILGVRVSEGLYYTFIQCGVRTHYMNVSGVDVAAQYLQVPSLTKKKAFSKMALQILKWSSAIKTDTGLRHTCMYNCQLQVYCRMYIANIQCTSYTAVNINISCPHMPPNSYPHKFTYYFCHLCQPPTHTWYMYMLQYKVKQDVCGHMMYGNNIMWLAQRWLRSQAPPILLLLFGSHSIKVKNWQEMGRPGLLLHVNDVIDNML